MLWQLEQSGELSFFLSEGRFTLGRDEACDLPVSAEGVSRLHALLDCDESGLRVHDQNSTNGVFVNGHPVDGSQLLQHGDEISFGQHASFRVMELEPPDDQATLILTQPSLGHWCLVEGEYVIGRDEAADVCMPHPDLSRQHAVLRFDGQTVTVRDNGSTNGLYDDGHRVQEIGVSPPGRIYLGPVPLFFSFSGARGAGFSDAAGYAAAPEAGPVGSPTAARPAGQDAFPLWAWLSIAILACVLIGGGLYLYGDLPKWGQQQRVVEEQTPQPSQQEVRARQAVSRVASNTELRNRIRTLARETREVRDYWLPVADVLDQSAGGLQRVTSNAMTRRLIAGTDLATLASSLNAFSGRTRQLVSDLTAMPDDLAALERGLQRYQSNPNRENLRALSGSARRTVTQGERIESLLGTVSGSIGSVRSGLDSLASSASRWPMGGGLADGARQSARILSNGKGMLDEYRILLQTDLAMMRELQREVGRVN